ADFDEAIRLEPREGLYFNNRGTAHLKQGDYFQARVDLDEAMRLSPALPNSYKNLAWLLATCPKAEFRDRPQAVAYAQKALELVDQKMKPWLAILAAAHAEAGNWPEAVKWQTQCLEQSPAQVKADLEARLLLYQQGRPYREYPDRMS